VGGEVVGPDHLRRAQCRDLVASRGVADGGDDGRPGHRAQLNRGDTHAPRRSRDEHAVAGRQPATREERVVGGRVHLREPAGLGPRERLRHGEEVALVHHHPRRLGTSGDEGHDPVAALGIRDARTGTHDLAGELEARDVAGGARRRGIAALPLEHVRTVEPGCTDRDEHLGVPRDRVRPLLQAESAVVDDERVHEGPPLDRTSPSGSSRKW
jgi:hypothetical protein